MKKFITGTINLFLMSVLCLTVFGISASAATFVVNTTSDTADASAGNGVCADSGGNCSLRAAISEANALAGADVITLPAGTYTQTLVSANENLNAGGDWDITTPITINGAGAATTILQANASPGAATERVLHCLTSATAVVINDVTIQNGNYAVSTIGGGLYLQSATTNVTLNRVTVTNNKSATSGGGIGFATAGAVLTVNDSTISNNSAGGAVSGSAGFGAGIYSGVNVTININNSTISNNTSNSSVSTVFGGGLASTGTGSTINISNSNITGNSSISTFSSGVGYGGGIHTRSATTLTNSTISGNTASGTGGGISIWISTAAGFTTAITGSTISNNTASNTNESGAGGLTFDSFASSGTATLNITDSKFTGNTSTAGAGGIGGALYTWCEAGGSIAATLTRSTISGNSGSFGGGLLNESDTTGNAVLNLVNSTISGNTSTGNGGGIYNFAASTTTGLATVNVTNSTISGNNSGANGGGITNEINPGATATAPTINLDYSTVASNTAVTNGGGLQQLSGAINIKDSIVGDNSAATGPDIFGTITSQDYNHIENTAGGTFFAASSFAMAHDVTGSDAQLGVLANNGGTTQTQAVGPASPVYNAIPNGTNGCGTTLTADQRGSLRPYGSGCEKGAFEYLAPTAAGAKISGQVLTANGRGIRNATVMISGGNLTQPQRVTTSSFGYYTFDNLPAGGTYVLQVVSKQYTFNNPSQVINLTEDLTKTNFVAVQP